MSDFQSDSMLFCDLPAGFFYHQIVIVIPITVSQNAADESLLVMRLTDSYHNFVRG